MNDTQRPDKTGSAGRRTASAFTGGQADPSRILADYVSTTDPATDLAASTAALAEAPADTEPEVVLIAVDLVLFNEYSQVLVILRRDDPFKGRWALPGGLVGTETLLAAAIREALEETGLDLTDVRLVQLGAYGDPGRDPRGRVVSVAYTAKLTGPVKAVASDDAAELRWIDPDTALHDGLAFDHNVILTDALDRLYDGALDQAGLGS